MKPEIGPGIEGNSRAEQPIPGPAMHAAALLSVDGWRSARLTGAGLGAAAGAQKHRPRIASMIAAHLIGLRLVGTLMGSDSPTILIAGVFEWASARGGEALLRAASLEPWVTLPTIAWAPRLARAGCRRPILGP
jgi:hypothetical protein